MDLVLPFIITTTTTTSILNDGEPNRIFHEGILITGAILPAISPTLVYKGTVEFRLAQLLVHLIVKSAKPLGQVGSAAGIRLIFS